MINHYRTLLLNIADQGIADDYISPSFLPLALPSELQAFYDLLYPKNSSRYFQQFVEFYFENLLYSSNQTQYLKAFDPRVTYDLSDLANYFAIQQVSAPVNSSYAYPLLVSGTYTPTQTVSSYYEGFIIAQVGSTSNITVQSVTSGQYLNGTLSSPIASSVMQIPLTFSNGMSNIFPIGTTGLNARISGNGANFTDSSNMTWTFIAQSPLTIDFETFFSTLTASSSVVNTMMNYGPILSNQAALWTSHFNPVYRIAGLINSYVNKVNSVWQTQT